MQAQPLRRDSQLRKPLCSGRSKACAHPDASTKLQAARQERALRRDSQRQKRLREAGIEYEYEPLAATLPAKAQRTVFAEE